MATNYKEKAKQARLKILEMIFNAGTSHIASNFSIIDIAVVLYENLKKGDEVVWSPGWKAASIYYFLAQQGKIPKEDLDLFGKEIEMNPNTGKVIKYLGLAETNIPGVLVNGGSVGHGLPVACGIALAKKLKGEDGRVFCIMSDGEMNEGTTWESAAFAGHHKLDNLIVIVDKNGFQAMGRTEEVLNIDPKRAFFGFGWASWDGDGHNYNIIKNAILHADDGSGRPHAAIFETIKGKGVSFMEDKLEWHYRHVDEESYKLAIDEIKYQ